jgi:hypothetical protein
MGVRLVSEMFSPVDSSLEAALTAPTRRASAKLDLNVRTVTQWFKLHHQLEEHKACNVPGHDNNVPEDYDGSRRRMTVAIGELNVCRWCFLAGEGK